MKDKEDLVVDDNVQDLENKGFNTARKDSNDDPWGCGTILIMFVVGLCVNMCSVFREIRNDSYDNTPHHYDYSSDRSHWSAASSLEDTTVNDSDIVDSVIPAYDKQ